MSAIVGKIAIQVLSSKKGRKIIWYVIGFGIFMQMMIISSPFMIVNALFDDGKTVMEVIEEYENNFHTRVYEELSNLEGEYNESELKVNGMLMKELINNNDEVMSVFSILINTDEEKAEQVLELDREKKNILKKVFEDMNSYSISSYSYVKEIEMKDYDEFDNPIIRIEEVEIKVKEVNVIIKSSKSMTEIYNFTDFQKEVLLELEYYIYEDSIDETSEFINNLQLSDVEFVGIEGWENPVKEWRNSVTSDFGMRIHPISGNKRFHRGVDIAKRKGEPVYSALSGTVVRAKYGNTGYGYQIVIDHGGKFTTLYAHLSKIDIKVGDEVIAGKKIGEVGTTGGSTGNHLHFEIRKDKENVNPREYLE